jgi:hypothetical protein
MSRKKVDINWDGIRAQYIYSTDGISLAELAKACRKKGMNVSQGTIGNRAAAENWVEQRQTYRNAISKNVEKRITTQITKRRIDNVKMVDALTKLGAKNLLMKLNSDPEFVLSASDIDKLMRLQEFLLGFSDSRQEKRIKLEKPLEDMSDEELDKIKDKMIQATFEVIDDESK